MPNDMQGRLSANERSYMDACRPTAADLVAFLDAQRVTIAPPPRADGSGWIISWDGEAHVFSAWGPRPLCKPILDRRCSSEDEALRVAHSLEHMLPLPQ